MSDMLVHCRERWEIDDSGAIAIGGLDIETVVEMMGGTPVFAYSRRIVATAVSEVRSAFPGVELFYSIKANPFSPLVGFIADLVDGFDVASSGELLRAVSAGAEKTIQFSGPGKLPAEMRQAIAAGALVNVESATQIGDLADAARGIQREPQVILRVNPGVVTTAAGLRMAGRGSQFGMEAEDVGDAIELCRNRGIMPLGFHFYWGTQCLDGTSVALAQRECWNLARALAERHRIDLNYLNLGGGFGIPYYRGDGPLDLTPSAEALAEIGAELREIQAESRLILELGRYLVGEAGLYLVRVMDVKASGGIAFIVTDGGMHHHLAASGNLGQGLKRSLPCYPPARMLDPPAEGQARVVGCLCTPIDLLCPEARLPEVRRGELLSLFQSGAYAASASPQQFLSHEPAGEVLL
jgi:diaminopimelate decarboxylase